MKITKLLVLFILSIIGGNKAIAQTDHLEPVNSIFDIYDFEFEYYSNVRNVLFNGLTDKPEVRFLIMPSFTPENVLDIEHDEKNGKYYLVYHICERMVWGNKNLKGINVNKYKREVSVVSARLIMILFETAIQKVEYPKENDMGLDGVNYYFTIRNLGQKSGTIWAPSESSKMGRLVKIGYELINLTKNDNEPCEFDDKFKAEITNLTTELKMAN